MEIGIRRLRVEAATEAAADGERACTRVWTAATKRVRRRGRVAWESEKEALQCVGSE